MWTDLRQKIIDVINAQSNKKYVAYRTPRSQFPGYPAITVEPSESESDYHDTANNRLNFIFTITIYQQIAKDGQDEADLKVEEVCDEILTMFLDRDILSPAALWVVPIPSRWGYQDRESGILRVAELKLRCATISPTT